ncbi:MAG: alpha/beta fold hydrolase [Acidobacteria bacterium]|nr:alpha/beta fold hydrolase [Acidobacteriota bacterium]
MFNRIYLRTTFAAFICALALVSIHAQAPAVADKQVEVFGQKIHYVEAGSGPTVILLHGLGGEVSNWAMTIPALSKQFHVIAIDQIGFGQSDKPLLNYRIGTMVDFLAGFYKQAGIAKATLVGNSLGGWIAAAFALAHPDKVEKLVLVDAAGYSPARTGAPKLTREQLAPLNAATLAELKQVMSLVFYNKALLTDAFIETAFAAKLRRGDGYTISQFTEMALRGDDMLDGKTKAIKTPTLVVWGREDGLTPLAIGEAYAQDIAGAEKVILDKCGHVPQLECAAAFNTALVKFLSASTSGK